jgi:general secretion pathway protein I
MLSKTKSQHGFTLIEVIVAMAILGITLVLVMQLFSGGLRASRASCDYTRAVVHAKDKMEEMMLNPVQGSGEFEDGFMWETEVQEYKDTNVNYEENDYKLLLLKVKIMWEYIINEPKSVELVSLLSIQKGENE